MRSVLVCIVLFLLFGLPLKAQESEVPPSAGTDFYFTVLDYPYARAEDGTVYVGINAAAASGLTQLTLYVNGQQDPEFTSDPFGITLRRVYVHPGDALHLTSTSPCYIDAFMVGRDHLAGTAVLPTQLLGTSYVLQGFPGTTLTINDAPTKTYSQFCVVATENYTTVSVRSPKRLKCVTRNRLMASNYTHRYMLTAGQALMFQAYDYTDDISGTQVSTNHPVAVFQGNNLTQIRPGEPEPDVVFEQARPVSHWGKEFIIPKSEMLKRSLVQITAAQNNTEVYCWVNGTKMYMTTLQAGEQYGRPIESGNVNTLQTVHIQTSQPVGCSLWTFSSSHNEGVGGPSMTEITPIDNPSTYAKWVLSNYETHVPQNKSLLVTTRTEDEAFILYNGTPLNAPVYDNRKRVETEEFVTYEINCPSINAQTLQATQGGFSAYVLQTGSKTESYSFGVSLPEEPYKPELCLDGQLLFREDFGGNDTLDPVVSTTPVPGMSSNYTQITNVEYQWGSSENMKAGRYLVAKRGYRNSTNPDYSCWHIMDDHTCSGDTTRGYFLEVDGLIEGEDVFFSTTLDSLCAGSQLSFSAWVANITTAGQYNAWRNDPNRGYKHPKLTFLITDDETGELLAKYNTDTIPHDWSNYPKSWRESAEWQQVGMNFVVPEGTNRVLLRIQNNVKSSINTGNDFALDDIEVRLCVPPVTILASDTVCIDTKNTFIADFTNDSTFVEPIEYQWYYSVDSLTWEPIIDGQARELKLKAKPRHTGWYQVAVAGAGGIQNTNCRAISEPFHLYVIPDCPPILCPEGVLLLHEAYTDSVTICDTTLRGLCANMDLSLIANLAPGHGDTRLMFRLFDPASGKELAAYDTGDVPPDSLQVGTSYTVPDTVSDIRWTITNNAAGKFGTPFALHDNEMRLCLEPISVALTDTPACRKKNVTLQAIYDNYGILLNPEFRWSYSADSLNWTTLQTSSLKTYNIPETHRLHEGWYTVTVADEGNMDSPNCRETSEPFRLTTTYCNTAVDQYIDTVACDTLLVPGYEWRGHEWFSIGALTDTLRDIDIDDSLYIHLALDTIKCCPNIHYFRLDSAVCDTLLPFLWFYRDTMLLFTDIGAQEIYYPHYKWETCTGEIHTLTLDTFHCERLYPLIVNKYNWQLVLDRVSLQHFFPQRQYLAYQWYKNGEPVPGAINDDYAEQNELNGLFQLCIRLDEPVDNHDEYIWSNILVIGEVEQPLPVIKRIYDARGWFVSEDQMLHGVYLIRYEQGPNIWTEKVFIP